MLHGAVLLPMLLYPSADPTAKPVDFRRDVHPILERGCFRCHSGADASAGVRLDVRSVLLGANSGHPLVRIGKSAESRLIQLVSGNLPDERMPPAGKGELLSPEKVNILRAWIDGGLGWEDRLLPPPDAAKRHWAFQPIQRPASPELKRTAWIKTLVDAFILQEQEHRRLAHATEAPRATLLRRLSLDLIGLPPTPAEIDAFLADRSPFAYELQLERLLASPHYGEGWARHWLDVARWAESEGYEDNRPRATAWRYRDYVVKSFNDDKPVDQFLKEQVAGDELLPYSDENLIATGFLANARYSGNEQDKALQRNDVLVDIVNATANATLGLSMACAQCHDHKFDPISHQDYYRFQGFFVQGQMNNLLLKDPVLLAKHRTAVEIAKPISFAPTEQLRHSWLTETWVRRRAEELAKLPTDIRVALETHKTGRTAAQRELAAKHEAKLQFSEEQLKQSLSADDRKLLDALDKKLAAVRETIPPPPQTIGFYSPVTSPTTVETLPLKATFPLPYELEQLRQTKPRLLVRGETRRPGKELDAGWPAIFGPATAAKSDRPRTALATWLASSNNPLTARVWANRVWHYHFGRGLCATPGDFGLRADAPSHPQLLDFLASELREHGWSTKRLHRLICNSATYRQAAAVSTEHRRSDSENRWYTRWSPRRLEAETIRDSILATTGELDRTIGGPSVALKDFDKKAGSAPEETGSVLRRTLYLRHMRDGFHPTYSLFDGPPASESCPRRHVSTVALQPLFLLNSDFMTKRAAALAERMRREAGPKVDNQITVGFRLALARAPSREERAVLEKLAATDLRGVSAVLLNLNEFVYLE